MNSGCIFQKCPMGWHLLSISQKYEDNFQKQTCIWRSDSMMWYILGIMLWTPRYQLAHGYSPSQFLIHPSCEPGSSVKQVSLQLVGLLSAQRMLLGRLDLSWLRDKMKDRSIDSVPTSIIQTLYLHSMCIHCPVYLKLWIKREGKVCGACWT